jgi:hypothetical protein
MGMARMRSMEPAIMGGLQIDFEFASADDVLVCGNPSYRKITQ